MFLNSNAWQRFLLASRIDSIRKGAHTMPKVVIRSLGIVLAAFMAFVGSQSLPANAALGNGVTAQVALAPTAGLALSDDNDDPMARCNAPADSSTPGEDGYTAPAPMKLDASGPDQDGICIPDDFIHPESSWGSYRLGNKMLMAGFNKVQGEGPFTVVADYNSGTWTFNFSTEQTGTEAANIYRLRVAKKCTKSAYSSDRYRRAWATVTNVADDTGRSFSVYPDVEHLRGWYNVVDVDSADNIPDGAKATMRLREYVSNGLLGLRPGKYKVTFWLSSSGSADVNKDYVGKRKKLFVPKCGARRH